MPEVEGKKSSKGDASDFEWAINTFGFNMNSQERFLYYGTGGLLDPKNYTLEPWVFSGRGSIAFWRWDAARWAAFGEGMLISQSVAFVGVGILGAIFDPLGKFEGEGMDEVWGDIFDWGAPRSKEEAFRSYQTKARRENMAWGLGNNIRIG